MKKKGMKGAPGLDAYKARQKEHEDSRGKKMRKEEAIDEIARKHPKLEENPYSMKNKLKMVGSSIKDRVKQKARALTTTHKEGTSYGLYKGDGKPKGTMANFVDAKKKKKETVKEVLGGVPNDGYIGHPNLNIKNPFAKKQIKKPVMPGSTGGGIINQTAGKLGDRNMMLQKLMNQSFKPEGEMVEAYGGRGSSRKARLSSIHPPTAKAAIKNIPDDTSDRGSGNKAKRRMKNIKEFLAGVPEGEVIDEMPKDIQNTLKGGLSSARDQFLDKGKVDVKGTLKNTLKNVLKTNTVTNFLDKSSYEPQGEMIEMNMSGQEAQLKAKQNREKTVKTQILNKKLQLVRKGQGQSVQASYEPQGEMIEAKDNCGCGKNPCETYGEGKEIPKNVKKIAKELDKAVAMHKDQAKRLRAAGVSEAKVDEKLPDYKRATARDKRYGNPHGSLEVGAGIRRDRRADHEERRGKKTKVKEGVKYYSGQDRNPNTGLPKGLKSSGGSKKEKPMTGVDYSNIQASYKPRFSVFDEAADRKMARATDQQLADAHKKYSGMDQSSPANAHMTKRITREMNRRKKAAKKKVDEAVGVSSEVSMSRARKEAELQRKEAQLKNKKMRKEHHQKDSNGKVIEHGGGSPSSLDELNRYEKEKGTDTKTGKPVTKGGTAKNDKAFQFVAKKYASQRMGANQSKKVKGAKSDEGTGRITRMLAKKKDQQAKKKALDAKAKAAGYKSTQDYVNVQAVRKGGLGT